MASEVSMSTNLLTAVLLAVCHVADGDLNQGSASVSLPGILQQGRQPPVVVDVESNVGKPGVLLYNLESESVIIMKYSLNCSSYDTIYSVYATTSATKVATITKAASFNISCAKDNLVYDSPGRTELLNIETNAGVSLTGFPDVVGIAEGEVNMTVRANMIGRSFLIILAHQISGFNQFQINAGNDNLGSIPQDELLSPFDQVGSFNDSHINSGITEVQRQEGSTPHNMPPNVVGKAMIIVMQFPRLFDKIFVDVLYAVIVLATTGMGVKVDFVVIKNVLRRPVGPIIGLSCQYLCMPLIAYLVAKVVPQENPAVSLGIFACGIVPGGGPSNMFTFLLGGDLSLSVTMTTLSSIASLGLLPLWLFTLGETFKDETVQMHVPFEKILEALAVAILPLFLGMLIKYKIPRVAQIISKVLKPVLIVIVAFMISFGVYTNFYIFKMIRPMTIFAGCLLPYIGYFVGGFVSFLSFRTWTHIKTIAIETGIQNTGIAFLILFLSLPPPDNQLASVGPASSAVMTPLPLFVAVFLYSIYQRCRKHKVQETTVEETKLENGSIQNEKSQVGVDVPLPEEELPLIIIIWSKITGKKPVRKVSTVNVSIKELEAMLPEKEILAKTQT